MAHGSALWHELDGDPLHLTKRHCSSQATLQLHVNTFWGNFELAALGDLDSLSRLITCGSLYILNLLDNIVAFKDFAKNDVSAIEPPLK